MEKDQSDTSSFPPSITPSASRSIKNPLLSAAVTNLTLDDFTHNAVLLPAASPFLPTITPLPPPAQLPVTTTWDHQPFHGIHQENGK